MLPAVAALTRAPSDEPHDVGDAVGVATGVGVGVETGVGVGMARAGRLHRRSWPPFTTPPPCVGVAVGAGAGRR